VNVWSDIVQIQMVPAIRQQLDGSVEVASRVTLAAPVSIAPAEDHVCLMALWAKREEIGCCLFNVPIVIEDCEHHPAP